MTFLSFILYQFFRYLKGVKIVIRVLRNENLVEIDTNKGMVKISKRGVHNLESCLITNYNRNEVIFNY